MLEYIPEGQDDCSRITLGPGLNISVWKEVDPTHGGKEFVLQWKINEVKDAEDIFQQVLNGPFKAIIQKSCFSTNFDVLINHCKFLSYVSEKTLHIQVTNFQDLFKIEFDSFDCEKIKIKFIGNFNIHIRSLNNNNAKNLLNLPENIRYYARDNNECLLIHMLLFWKKEVCEDGILKQFINVRNSSMVNCCEMNVLHYSCMTNDLRLVTSTLVYGGPIEQIKDNFGKYPSDYTTNEQIKLYLKQLQI